MEVQPKLRRHFGHLDPLRLKKPQSRSDFLGPQL